MSDWSQTRLDECCQIVGGATPSTSVPAYWDGDICWATPKDLSELQGAYISDTPRKLTRAGLDSCAATVLPVESVLFSSRAPIGHVAVNTIPMTTNQGFKSFIPKADRVHAKFLYHWLRKNRPYLEGLGNGATFKEVSKAVVSRIEISLPPLLDQERIADVLDRAEALRAKRRSALAQLDILTHSIFLDMFGDPRANEKGWNKVPIGSLISGVRGGAPLKPEDFVESGFPILHKGAIKSHGEISLDAKKKTFSTVEYASAHRQSVANRECLAITLRDLVPTGPSIGLVVDLRKGPHDEYLLAQGAYAFRVNLGRTTPEYFVYLSNMPTFRHVLRQNAVGSTQIHIRTPIYLAISVPLPPVELQRTFARRVEVVEKLRAKQQASLVKVDTLFDSMQSRAFNGEL